MSTPELGCCCLCRAALPALLLRLLLSFAHAQPGPRTGQPGPWDQDIVVYRVPLRGASEKVAVFPRAGVATAARLGDGRLAVAHQHFPENNAADFDKVAIHFSADEGRTWSEAQVIRLKGLPDGMRFPFDPTLVPLPDGRTRLYFTSRRQGSREALPAIYSAVSENAVDYTFEAGMRFGIEGRGVIDCAVVLHRGVFHLFSPDNGAGHPSDPGRDARPAAERPQDGVGYHATSKDGLAFERRADVRVAGRRHWLGDAKSDGDQMTFYGTGEGGVWTAISTDGNLWAVGEPIRGIGAADPGTVKLKDGSLLIAGSGPPRPGTPSAQRRPQNPPASVPKSPPKKAVYPGKTWEQRTPQDAGLDAGKLAAFAANVGGDGCIIKDGYLVQTWGELSTHKWWASASKPVFSTLLLVAAQEGRLPGVDAPVKLAGWELAPKDATMTFRQLANMTSGYACAEPSGAAWGYNDFAIQLYARSLEKVFGQPIADAFAQRFAALEFEDGAFFGHRNNLGVVASPRDFARLGWLWLNRGRWNGVEVLSEKLWAENIRAHVPADWPRAVTKGTQPDDYLGLGSYGGGTNQTPHGPGVYGFNFWFNRPTPTGERVWPAAPPDVYQANGLWNRDTLTIFPGLRMVVAARGAHPGKFEPGIAGSEYDRNMRLLMEAVNGARAGP
jgi:hypothetical protein